MSVVVRVRLVEDYSTKCGCATIWVDWRRYMGVEIVSRSERCRGRANARSSCPQRVSGSVPLLLPLLVFGVMFGSWMAGGRCWLVGTRSVTGHACGHPTSSRVRESGSHISPTGFHLLREWSTSRARCAGHGGAPWGATVLPEGPRVAFGH